ncbi:MAG: hypothetical protein H3C28_01420 [Sphingomonadales bacterium]|nr:hypothetical protein [Sphingomonadales bacterium]
MTMTLDELETLIAGHGARRERWPDEARRRADALIAASPAAARLVAEARALDGLLDSYQVAAPSPDLRARLLSAAMPPVAEVMKFPAKTHSPIAFSSFWPQAAALMAASFVGLWLGINIVSVPLFNEQDLSGYVLGNDGDVIASLEEGQP